MRKLLFSLAAFAALTVAATSLVPRVVQKSRTVASLSPKQHVSTMSLARHNAPARQDDAAQWETLLNEDFSLFTAGTDEAPDMDNEYLGWDWNLEQWLYNDEMFSVPGWSGYGIYSAGGAIALAIPGIGGYVNTPEMNLSGHIRVSFRAKSVGGSSILIVSSNYNGTYDPYGQSAPVLTLNAEDGWKDYSFEFDNTHSDGCFIQFNANFYQPGKTLLDDVRIERNLDAVATPGAVKGSNFVTDGFTASWDPAFGADHYKVNVYERKAIEDESSVATADMAALGIDSEAEVEKYTAADDFEEPQQGWTGNVTGLPEGWQIKGSSLLNDEEGFEGATTDLVLRNGDQIVIDGNGSNIEKLKFAYKVLNYDASNGYFNLTMASYAGDDWATGGMYLMMMKPGVWNIYDTEDDRSWYSDLYTQVVLTVHGSEADSVAFGMFESQFSPKVNISVCRNLEAKDNFVELTGLDLNNDYAVEVAAVGAKGNESPYSPRTYCYGVAAPHALPATNVSDNGFTANWEEAKQAGDYYLSTYQVYTVPQAVEAYPVLDEKFSKCEGKDGAYRFLGNYDYEELDEFTDNIGWTGSGTLVGDSCLGCYTDEWQYYMYDMMSPALSLGHNGGKYTVTVEYKVQLPQSSDDDDYYGEQREDVFVFQGVSQAVKCPIGDGSWQKATATLTDGADNLKIMFYTRDGSPFVMRHVLVSQDLEQGDQVLTWLTGTEVEGNSYTFTDVALTPDVKIGYNLKSRRYRADQTYWSMASNLIVVGDETTAIKSLDAGNGQQPAYYDLMGRRIMKPSHGIYVVKQGGKTVKKQF